MEIAIITVDFNQPQNFLGTYNPQYSDIHKYRICVVPDLHGNFIKLISVPIHLGIIGYRQEPERVHAWLLSIKDELERHIGQRLPQTSRMQFESFVFDLLDERFQLVRSGQRPQIEIIFLGDVLCDRGVSDLLTLSILLWMKRLGIRYRIICGNHDFLISCGHSLSTMPVHVFSGLSTGTEHPHYRSFDYFKLNEELKEYFVVLLKNFVDHLKLFIVDFICVNASSPFSSFLQHVGLKATSFVPILFTHTPCRKFDFIRLISKLNAHTAQINIPQILNREMSFIAQYHLNTMFIEKIFIPGMTTSLMDSSPELRMNMEEIQKFCTNRDCSDSFFSTPEDGLNIFGHMAEENTKPWTKFSPTQLCLDLPTGMPNFPVGQIQYAFL